MIKQFETEGLELYFDDGKIKLDIGIQGNERKVFSFDNTKELGFFMGGFKFKEMKEECENEV